MNCVCHSSKTATAELGNTSPDRSKVQWRQYLMWIRLICTDPSQNSNSQSSNSQNFNSQNFNSQNFNSKNSNSQNLPTTTIKDQLDDDHDLNGT